MKKVVRGMPHGEILWEEQEVAGGRRRKQKKRGRGRGGGAKEEEGMAADVVRQITSVSRAGGRGRKRGQAGLG